MISLRKIQRRKLRDDDLVEMGYDPISRYDRSLAQVEDLLCMRTSCDEQPSTTDLSETHRPQLWNEVVTHLDFDERGYHDLILSRYYTSEISSDCGAEKYSNVKRIQEPGCNTLNQRKKVPKAWLDMMDRSNMFPGKGAHSLHKLYGLKDFVVMSVKDSEIGLRMSRRFLKTLSRVANKCQSQLPVFVDCTDSFYIGFLECDGFRTFFKAWDVSKPSVAQLNMNHIDRMKWNLSIEEYQFQCPAKITTLSYCIDLRESCKKHTPDDFKKYEDYWYDNNIPFVLYLNATWSEQLKTVVTGCGIDTELDPLDAPEWSVRAKIAEKPDVELGDCLKKFLSLCSESLPSNTKKLTKRKYKQRKEIKVRKVSSKSSFKPQESIIPVKPYNAILEFLFRDAKLQPFQHSNGSNPSTTTTVEDEVEDKFFLSYKEPSKYFKSAHPSGLLSRLAISLCIINKYHGGLEAVTQLWGEFVLRMKHCLENNYEIKGLETDEPKVDSELLQKLQVLNSCIKKKKALSPITDTSSESIDEHKEKDKITNEVKRIKTSYGMRPVFKKSIQEFPDDDAKKVLDWLALVKPSDLVLSLMPMLIHSAITSLLKHSVCQLDFLQEHLNQFSTKLIHQIHNEASELTSGIKMFEDHIHQLTIIEQKVAIARRLLKTFREVDPSDDAELQKYIAELVKSREVPINDPTGKLPSETSFGKLVRDLFCIGYETRKAESDPKNAVIGLGQYFKEYNSILDCSKTKGLCLRLRCIVLPKRLLFAAACVGKEQIACFSWSD